MEESKYWLEEAPVRKAIIHMAVPMIFGMAIMFFPRCTKRDRTP